MERITVWLTGPTNRGDRYTIVNERAMRPVRLDAYLDAFPVRRRLRTALVICFICALGILWAHAIPTAWKWTGKYVTFAPHTQAALDEEYRKCGATSPASPANDPWGYGFGDGLVGAPGVCHRADAAAENNRYRMHALFRAAVALATPIPAALVAGMVTIALWTVIPLAERRQVQPRA